LLTHPDVRMVSFTGSIGAARTIAGKAARTLKRTAFELGGTDALIVLDDADLGAAADAVIGGRLTNGAGQICCAVKRVLVDERVYAPFLDLLQERCKGIRMGDPTCEHVDIGPLISPDAAAKVERQVQESVDMGARCIAGGK